MKEQGQPLQNQKACEGEDAVLLRKAGVLTLESLLSANGKNVFQSRKITAYRERKLLFSSKIG